MTDEHANEIRHIIDRWREAKDTHWVAFAKIRNILDTYYPQKGER